MTERQQLTVGQVGEILAEMQAGLPQTPGLTEPNIRAYHAILGAFPLPILKAAMVRVLRDWEYSNLLPTPGALYRAALDMSADALNIPDPARAWSWVRKWIKDAVLVAPDEAHALVHHTITAMGGLQALAMSSKEGIDRTQFLKLYTEASRGWVERIMVGSPLAKVLPGKVEAFRERLIAWAEGDTQMLAAGDEEDGDV